MDIIEFARKGGSSKSDNKTAACQINGKLGGRPSKHVLNPDGVSVKGCSYIYAPAGQAGEYAPLAANPYRGCGHACAYCYVPLVLKIPRPQFNAGAVERPDFLLNMQKDAKKYQALGITEQVMLSFTSDPYHPANNSLTRNVIKNLQHHGLAVCTLSKGGTRSLRDLDLFRPDRDSHACTITSMDDAFAAKWEPGAAPTSDRVAALKAYHEAGIYTWVSMEPTLDVDAGLRIIAETHQFVDLYKIGRVNYLPMTKTTDWESYTHRIIELCQKLGVDHYIKKDLQPFLPDGYPNVLRKQQHH